MPAPSRKGAYFLILVSRALTLGEGEGPANVDGKDGTHSSSPDYTAPPGQKMQRFSVFMKKSKKPAETFVSTGSVWSGRRGSTSLPPPWQGGALPDELRPHKKITENLFGDFFVGCPSPT